MDVCHKSTRLWVDRFGTLFAKNIRKQRSSYMRQVKQWQWHLDEVFVKISGVQHYLWRAVDHEGEVFESFVTKKRDEAAALKFLKEAMKRYGKPQVIVTDRCPSYAQSSRKLAPPFSTTREGHAQISANAKSAEVRRHALITVQSFLSPEKHRKQSPLQKLRNAALLEWRELVAA